jgi:hypothetical protein
MSPDSGRTHTHSRSTAPAVSSEYRRGRFSFDSICQVFDINSAMLRQRLNSIGRKFCSRAPFFRG